MKLLIIKPSSLGDIIHGLQVVQSIKAQLPQVEINWVARDIFAPLVEASSCVDRVLIFQRGGGIGPFNRLLQEIREEVFDFVFDLQGLARSGVMTQFAKSKNKIGRSDARELSGIAYHKKVPLPENGRKSHAIEILLQFLPELGLEPKLSGHLSFQHVQPPVDSGSDAILIFPSSRRAEKDWGGFAELTGRLLAEHPQERIIWAGHEPMELRAASESGQFINLTGKTNLVELVSLIAEAKLVISNDSGPMHLASAMGQRLVAIFGPTPPECFGPYPLNAPQHCVIQATGGDLSRLSVDEVLPAVQNSF